MKKGGGHYIKRIFLSLLLLPIVLAILLYIILLFGLSIKNNDGVTAIFGDYPATATIKVRGNKVITETFPQDGIYEYNITNLVSTVKWRLGKLIHWYYYKYYLPDGQFNKFYENGQIYIKGEYLNGEREGQWVLYSREGVLQGICNFINGQRNGECVSYNSKGTLLSQCNYTDDQRNGECVTYSSDGALLSKGIFNEGKGIEYFYSTGGSLLGSGLYDSYDGLGNYAHEQEGIFVSFYEDGQIKTKKQYTNGEKNGREISYYKNGNIKYIIPYEEGWVKGRITIYYENGSVKYEGNSKDFIIDWEEMECGLTHYSEEGDIIERLACDEIGIGFRNSESKYLMLPQLIEDI